MRQVCWIRAVSVSTVFGLSANATFRSDAAYDRAAAGAGNADGFKVVETGANGLVTKG